MKKFLFTLLTLFMASSAFAEGGNYLTMNDYTVVKTKLETKQVSVGVKAHFDNYVSAMQVWVEVPEGVTLRGASAGNDYGISYMDNMGMDKVATPEITFKDGKFVIASMAAAYGDDGDTFYGVAKWAPGDYANYLNFVFRCNADFKGGDVKIIAAPACGDDTRPEVVANRADGTSYTTTSALSVKYIAPEPVLTWDENNYSMTATLPEGYNADDYEIVMMANGVEVQNTYTVDQTSEDQTIEFTAYTKHAADETYDSNDATYGKETKQTVTVPAKVETDLPFEATVKVNHTGDENNFYLLYRTEGNDPDQNPVVTVTVTVDGTPLTNVEFLQNWTLVQDYTDPDNGYMKAIYNHVKLAEPGEHTVKVELTVAPGPGYAGDPKTASAEWKYTIKNKFQGEIVFGDVDPTTGKMKVSYNGPETDYTMSISLNGQDAVVENGMIQLKEGANTIFVTVSKVGYDMLQAEATPTWTKPAPQDLQGQIVFGEVDEETGLMPVSYNGNENVTLTVTINGEKVEVVNGKVQLVDGNNVVVVTATAAGYNDLTETKEIEWTKPVVPVEDKIYVKFTGNELPVGKKIIFVYENGENSLAMGTVGTKGAPVAVVVANGEVNIANTEVVEFTVGGGEVAYGTDIKQYTLEYSAGFLAYSSSTNFKTMTSIDSYDTEAYWRLQTGDNGYVLNNANSASRYIRKHASNNNFGPYAKSNDSEEVVIYVEKTDEPVLEDLTGNITIGDPDANGGVAVAYTGDEDVTLTVTVKDADGKEVEFTFEDGVVTLPDYGTYTVEVVASADGYKDKEAEKEVTWTKPTPKDLTGEITIGDPDDNGGVAVAYTGNENVTLAVTVKDAQGNVVPATFENGVVTLPDYGTYTVEVVASADGYKDKEAEKEVTWTKPTPKQLTGTITFSVTQGNKNDEAAGIVTATYNGEETGVTVEIVGATIKAAAATSEGYRLPNYGTYQVKAVATAEGYADLNGEGQVTWEEPQTAAPEITVTEDGLTVEATGAEGTVTLYVVNADGSETAIDNPTTFDQKDESYTVNLKAVAHVDGAKDGVATKTIVIPAKSTEPGTGVNELVDGKAVKSVRYFNMAGQEMQEVNGVTIVVTTYTDGTTSAVKVMK